MKIPFCQTLQGQGCQGTRSHGLEHVIQSIFPVRCGWHISGLAGALPQISLELPHVSDQDKKPLLIVFTELVSSEFHSNFQIKQQKML
jgi:hypothetical protein